MGLKTREFGYLAAAIGALCVLATASLFIGVGAVNPLALLQGDASQDALVLLLVSRVPRTLAIIFVGMSMGISAVIMQMLFRNRFIEPTTAGTAESAALGLLVVALLAPGLPVFAKMLVAALFALGGSFLFLRIVDGIVWRSALIVPLIGLMLGGVIGAIATFLAYRYDMLQSLASWTNGDFSAVLQGRYEILWLTVGLAAIAYIAADRFTVAGLGDAFTTNLGLNYRKIVTLGLIIVSLVTAVCAATVGTIPFLGLIVANVTGLIMGDNLRRILPWIAIYGAGFLLVCDMLGRVIRYPYEIPVGVVAGVVGSVVFLYLLLGRRWRFG